MWMSVDVTFHTSFIYSQRVLHPECVLWADLLTAVRMSATSTQCFSGLCCFFSACVTLCLIFCHVTGVFPDCFQVILYKLHTHFICLIVFYLGCEVLSILLCVSWILYQFSLVPSFTSWFWPMSLSPWLIRLAHASMRCIWGRCQLL